MGIVALTALGVGGATAIGALIGFLFKKVSTDKAGLCSVYLFWNV